MIKQDLINTLNYYSGYQLGINFAYQSGEKQPSEEVLSSMNSSQQKGFVDGFHFIQDKFKKPTTPQ